MKLSGALCAVTGLLSTVAAVAIDPLLSHADNITVSISERFGPEVQSSPDIQQFRYAPGEKNLTRRTMWADQAWRGITVWPPNPNVMVGNKQLNAIFYCHANDESRNLLKPNFDIAIYQWYTRLGGSQHIGPSREAGHTIYFMELNINCYGNNYRGPSDPGTWQIPAGFEDALAIHKSTGYLAHMGYQPANRATPHNRPGRHYLELIPIELPTQGASSRELRNYFHELGHVLGLAHEHQHPDAPVRVHCENLPGYETSIAYCLDHFGRPRPGDPSPQPFAAWARDPDGRRKMGEYLCTPNTENIAWALACGSNFPAYCKNHPGEKAVKPYDPHSIMHYPTIVKVGNSLKYFDFGGNMQWDPSKAQLTGLVNGEERPMGRNYDISDGDVAAVKQFYPWR